MTTPTKDKAARIGQETRETRILIGASRRKLETAMRHAVKMDDPVTVSRIRFLIKELQNEERTLERRAKK